jgi:hypothetical protein
MFRHWERPFLTETLGLWAEYIAILFEVPKQFRPSCCGHWHEFAKWGLSRIRQRLFQNPSPSAFHLQIQQVRNGWGHVQVVNVTELLSLADSPAAQD